MLDLNQHDFDPVSVAHAGVVSYRCECGWEMVFIVPEESLMILQTILWHFHATHLLRIPVIMNEFH
jgi:hypothetical protein